MRKLLLWLDARLNPKPCFEDKPTKGGNISGLLGLMVRYGMDAPDETITKKASLIFADGDIEAVEEAFAAWEAAGILKRLADIRTVSPETVIARYDWKLLQLLGDDALEGKKITETDRTLVIRRSNQSGLFGSLTSMGGDASWPKVKAIHVLGVANYDIGAIEEAFLTWEAAGMLTRLADIRTAAPDTEVAAFDRKLLKERGREVLNNLPRLSYDKERLLA